MQLQPPKHATLKLTAIDNKGTDEKGAAFIAGLTPVTSADPALDETVDITGVSVLRGGTTLHFAPGGAAQSGISVDFTGDTALISGLNTGDKVSYTTSALHNRVLVENAGSQAADHNSAFDIGNFNLGSTTHSSTALADVAIHDDVPTIDGTLAGAPALVVDESALGTDDSHSFAAQFTPAYGTDGAAASTPVSYALSTVGGGSGLVDSATGSDVYLFLQGGEVVGRVGDNAAGDVVFVVAVDASGNVSLDQQRAVIHTPDTGTDQSLTLSGIDLVVLTATVTDKDGDTAAKPLDITGQITFKDDAPGIEGTLTGAPALQVDESALGTDDSQSFAAQFTPNYGADGAAATDPVTYALSTAGGSSGLVDSATGSEVYLFLQDGGHVVGRVGNDAAGEVVFVVSVDGSGNVALDQQRAVMHSPDTGADQGLTLSGTDLVVLTATATDKDGDTASTPLDITGQITFKDDAPTLDGTLTDAPSLLVDEAALGTADTHSFAAQFTPDYGADGAAATDPVVYALGTAGGPSGLVDSATGSEVYLFLQAGEVVGRVGDDAAGDVVFTISVDTAGNVSLEQQRAIVHDPALGQGELMSLSGTDLVVLTATVTDKDGDAASKPLDITAQFGFEDEVPTIDATITGAPSLVVDDSALGTNDSQSFSAQFTVDFGPDQGAPLPVTYALSTAGGASGLVDSATGTGVYLFLEGGEVVGRVGDSGSGDIVFVVAVDASGNVSLDQQRAVMHTPDSGPDQSLSLSGTNLVVLTGTVEDGDHDTDAADLDITRGITFKDDAPTIEGTLTGAPALVVDESVLATNDSQSFAAQFTPDYGADGAAATDPVTYALSTAGGWSGLVDSATGSEVYLFLEDGAVVGRVGDNAAGAIVFVVGVDASGHVSLDQQRAVMHTPDSGANQGLTLSGTDRVVLTATATDKDGDTASAPLDITGQITFRDDAPTLAFGNVVGTGSAAPQYGYWSALTGIGADGVSASPGLDIAQDGFQLVRPDGSTTPAASFTLDEATPSPDASGAYVYHGTVTADFDNNAATAPTSLGFTLTAYADGRYAIDLAQGFGSTTETFRSSDGLAAGRPDPVRTLYIPNETSPVETVVFFAAKALATTSQIQAGIGIASAGQPDFDPTEAQLQTTPLPGYIDPRAMNVSTSGIGVANNVLQGDGLAAIGAADESFVVNPKSLVTSVKVFIDNSVGGYNTATEDLYYRAYYSDGSYSGLTRVTAAMLSPESGGQESFVVQREGSKLIDAVQLVMARGDVKIPVIEFSRESVSEVSGIHLDFSATLTDKDGDSATSHFSATLNANQLGSSVQYQLDGTAGVRDNFNIDLASDKTVYRVTGFDTGSVGDKLVLLGAAGVTPVIDNTGTDSVVTIAEAGGQVTTVTVVGVDLQATDLMLVAA